MDPSVTTTSAPLCATSDSDAWLAALRGTGPAYDQAVEALHALLLRAARFELLRRRASLGYVRGEELEDIALQAALHDARRKLRATLADRGFPVEKA